MRCVIEKMVGTRRLELLTFPARRDALRDRIVEEFLDGAMRLPGLDLSLAPTRLGKRCKVLALNQNPRSAILCVWAMPALVLA